MNVDIGILNIQMTRRSIADTITNVVLPGLAVIVSNVNITDWFNAANLTDDKEYVGVILTKKNTTQIEVSFTSGKNNVSFRRLS